MGHRVRQGVWPPDHGAMPNVVYLLYSLGMAPDARSGSEDGFIVLISYLADNRALLAEHAHRKLVAITGQDYGKNIQSWNRWIHIPEPVQTWNERMLTFL